MLYAITIDLETQWASTITTWRRRFNDNWTPCPTYYPSFLFNIDFFDKLSCSLLKYQPTLWYSLLPFALFCTASTINHHSSLFSECLDSVNYVSLLCSLAQINPLRIGKQTLTANRLNTSNDLKRFFNSLETKMPILL